MEMPVTAHPQQPLANSVALDRVMTNFISLQIILTSSKLASYNVPKSLETSRAAAFNSPPQMEIVFEPLMTAGSLFAQLRIESALIYAEFSARTRYDLQQE